MISTISSGAASQAQDVKAPQSASSNATNSAGLDFSSANPDPGFKVDTFTPSTDAVDTSWLSIDTVSISPSAANHLSLRSDKIEALRGQISAGSYKVSSSDVAQAMLRKGLFDQDVE